MVDEIWTKTPFKMHIPPPSQALARPSLPTACVPPSFPCLLRL